ncbi:MAG: hypothetical protein ACREQ7_18410 [Candidatus Binatia bacterium]
MDRCPGAEGWELREVERKALPREALPFKECNVVTSSAANRRSSFNSSIGHIPDIEAVER